MVFVAVQVPTPHITFQHLSQMHPASEKIKGHSAKICSPQSFCFDLPAISKAPPGLNSIALRAICTFACNAMQCFKALCLSLCALTLRLVHRHALILHSEWRSLSSRKSPRSRLPASQEPRACARSEGAGSDPSAHAQCKLAGGGAVYLCACAARRLVLGHIGLQRRLDLGQWDPSLTSPSIQTNLWPSPRLNRSPTPLQHQSGPSLLSRVNSIPGQQALTKSCWSIQSWLSGANQTFNQHSPQFNLTTYPCRGLSLASFLLFPIIPHALLTCCHLKDLSNV